MKLNTIALSALILGSGLFASDANMEVKKEGVKYIKMLGGALKSELQVHMKEDKTGLTALEFCTVKATEITAGINKKLPEYASVRRASLKTRNNSKNSADELDVKIMQEYVASIESKTFTAKDIKVVKDGDTTRIYKPLVTSKACLKCHGSNLSPEITDALKKNYPNDKAINFKEGDLRGVVVSEIKKH